MSVAPLHIGPLLVDPPLLQAPMAGFTNYAFRQVIRRFGGVGLPATEMVSARGFMHMAAPKGTVPFSLTRKSGQSPGDGRFPDRLWGVADEPRPLAVQIWDNDPDTLAAVGRRLAEEFRVSVVDLNFGCPVRDVFEKAESGSYLLRYPDRIGQIVARVAAACPPVPVTAKIRLGATRDTINAIDVAQAIESAGGAAATSRPHGHRSVSRLGRLGGDRADQATSARDSADRQRRSENAQAVAAAFHRYGVDGVMIGRAALSQPWLFRQAAAALRGEPVSPQPTPLEQRQLLLDHFRLVSSSSVRRRGRS